MFGPTFLWLILILWCAALVAAAFKINGAWARIWRRDDKRPTEQRQGADEPIHFLGLTWTTPAAKAMVQDVQAQLIAARGKAPGMSR
jgi:hypothetical protein